MGMKEEPILSQGDWSDAMAGVGDAGWPFSTLRGIGDDRAGVLRIRFSSFLQTKHTQCTSSDSRE